MAAALAITSVRAADVPQHLHRHEASHMSMACAYAIEAYGPDAEALPRILNEAFDEVDRIDRLMSHYKADSALSRINRAAARSPVTVEPELFDFIADAMRYHLDSGGAFDITVGPLMKAWGFFRGDGRMPADDELISARLRVGGSHVILNPLERTIAFDDAGVELDLGGIAKGYAVDRVVRLLKQQKIAAALISAGGSTVYGLRAPPDRDGWDVAIQDPIDPRQTALTVRLKDRALSMSGSSEKRFESGGVSYSHIMDPRTGRPAQGVLSVAVLANTGTAGDALDNAFFVLGPEGSQSYLKQLPDTEAVFFLPEPKRGWKMVRQRGGSAPPRAQKPEAPARANTVDTGTINGAPFHIEIPAQWNKGLVLYAHGYRMIGDAPPNPDSPRMRIFRDVFLSRGFAFAASDYRAQGWAVKEAIEDTEALRRYFVSKHGTPAETYITGHSMGGHITMAVIERYPEAYHGALPMCGPLGPAIEFLNAGPFDMLVTFEALFPGTIGSPYEPSPETGKNVKAALGKEPQRAARYAQRYGRTIEQLPGALSLFHAIVGELKQRAGGEPFDNRNRIYVGFGDDVALNRLVKRYGAAPSARDYIRQYATPTGRIADPILTIHTTSDALVLGSDVTAYEVPAALAGTSERFVARFVEADGHCNFTPAQTGSAFEALLAWVREGKPPAAGEQK